MNECYFERYLLNIYDLLISKKINMFEIFFMVRVMADDQIIYLCNQQTVNYAVFCTVTVFIVGDKTIKGWLGNIYWFITSPQLNYVHVPTQNLGLHRLVLIVIVCVLSFRYDVRYTFVLSFRYDVRYTFVLSFRYDVRYTFVF